MDSMPYEEDHDNVSTSPPPIPTRNKGKGRAKPPAKPPTISLTEADAGIAAASHSIVAKNASLLPSLTITADSATRNLRSTSRVRERAPTESPREMVVDGDTHVAPSAQPAPKRLKAMPTASNAPVFGLKPKPNDIATSKNTFPFASFVPQDLRSSAMLPPLDITPPSQTRPTASNAATPGPSNGAHRSLLSPEVPVGTNSNHTPRTHRTAPTNDELSTRAPNTPERTFSLTESALQKLLSNAADKAVARVMHGPGMDSRSSSQSHDHYKGRSPPCKPSLYLNYQSLCIYLVLRSRYISLILSLYISHLPSLEIRFLTINLSAYIPNYHFAFHFPTSLSYLITISLGFRFPFPSLRRL